MALHDLMGQEQAVGMLLGILRRGRTASAYLFSGEPGIGKKTAAIDFAKALNCLSAAHIGDAAEQGGMFSPASPAGESASGEPGGVDACDSCDSCLKASAGTHPDLIVVSPEERQIRIEEVRRIDEALSFKPFEGRMKAVIVDDADLMNIAAANAFLKTLEEPPPASVIILVSSRPDMLPATIRSRCSRISFSPLPAGACREVLRGRVAESALEAAARLSMGRPGLALTSDLLEERDRTMELFHGMLRAEKDAWASREEMERWFDNVMVFLRDLAVFKTTGRSDGLINADVSEDVVRVAKTLEIKAIIYFYMECARLRRMLMFNLNKSITWNYTAAMFRKEIPS